MFGGPKMDVLVVGAGPTGLVAALQLAELGLGVEVIEEEWRSAGHSYALALHPASLELLDALGVSETLLTEGRQLETVTLFEGAEPRATLRFGELPTRFQLLALPQSVLEGLLAKRLADKGVRVRWSHRLARLTPKDDGVVATVHKLEKQSTGYAVAHTEWAIDKEIEFKAGFVVGADGHRSLVRRALDLPFEEVAPSQVFAVVECGAAPGPAEDMRLVFGPATVSALWPLPAGRARWSLELEAPEVSGEDRFKSRLTTMMGERFFPHLDEARIRQLLRERAPWFELELRELGWSIEVRFERRLAGSFGRDRVWLAGDAGHLTGPAGMQSMNLGLREASDLATRVARCHRGEAGQNLLEAYGQERLAEWRLLLGKAGGLRPGPAATPFATRHAERLLPCLPATGDHLGELARQLGLELDRG